MARGIEEGPEPHLAFCAHRRSDCRALRKDKI
jgi:hypothetical protein